MKKPAHRNASKALRAYFTPGHWRRQVDLVERKRLGFCMKNKALHIVHGGVENGDKAWLEKASRNNLDSKSWIAPKSAKPGDDVVIYVSRYGFFATAIVKGYPKPKTDWHKENNFLKNRCFSYPKSNYSFDFEIFLFAKK